MFAARLKPDDITYIFDFAEVDSIVVDNEYVSLLDDFKKTHPKVKFIIDTVSLDPPRTLDIWLLRSLTLNSL